MKDKRKLLAETSDAAKLVNGSRDDKSIFVHLKRYLDLLHNDQELLDCIKLEAEKEKSSLDPRDIEIRKYTSFWLPWEELNAFWQLDNFGQKDAETIYRKNTVKLKGKDRYKINLTDEAGMFLAKYELDEAHKGNITYAEAGFIMEDYRRYFETVSLKVRSLLESSAPIPVATAGKFELKSDDEVYYEDKIINIKPQLKRLARNFIKNAGEPVIRADMVDMLWAESSKVLDNSSNTADVINRRISSRVSELNTVLRKKSKRTHVVNAGETSYKFIP
ncbi:MAG: hypothetical protein ACRDFB_09120 [Rhabdochlamydiaceae bacterium]